VPEAAFIVFQLFVLTPGAPARDPTDIVLLPAVSVMSTDIIFASETDVSNATARPITIFFILPQSHRIYA
jgi:hypothetical protein